MRGLERQHALRRHRRKRQRQVLLGFVGIAALTSLFLGFSQPAAPYPWLKVPDGFYRPDMVSLAAASTTEAPLLKPLPVQQEDQALRQKLQAQLASYPKTLKPHLFYFNLQDDSYVDINGEEPVSAASVIKLPILFEFFRTLDHGGITPYTHLMYENFEQAAGSGMLQYRTPGQPLLAKDVATMMIQSSDNTCTNMLIYNLGGAEGVNRLFATHGLHQTHIGNWLPDLTGTNVISMQDMATVLYNIAHSDLLTPQSRQAALEILKGTHNRRLLPALLPKGTVIAHKTGDIGTSLGNSGLIQLPNGREYIVAIQVERPYNDYTAKEMIQQVSKTIYDDVSVKNAVASSSSTATEKPAL